MNFMDNDLAVSSNKNLFADRFLDRSLSLEELHEALDQVLKVEKSKILVVEASPNPEISYDQLSVLCTVSRLQGDFPVHLDIHFFELPSFMSYEFEKELASALHCSILMPYAGRQYNPYEWILIPSKDKLVIAYLDPELLDQEESQLKIVRYGDVLETS